MSLLSVDDGAFEILDAAGDIHLGGEDIDNRVIEYITKQYKTTGADVTGDYRALGKQKSEVKKAKRTLSSQMSAKLEIDCFEGGNDLSDTLTLAMFEDLNNDPFRKTLLKNLVNDKELPARRLTPTAAPSPSVSRPPAASSLSPFPATLSSPLRRPALPHRCR